MGFLIPSELVIGQRRRRSRVHGPPTRKSRRILELVCRGCPRPACGWEVRILYTLFSHALHRLGMARPCDAGLLRSTIELWMDIVAALTGILLLLDGNAVGVGPGVLTNAGHLPGDFTLGLSVLW